MLTFEYKQKPRQQIKTRPCARVVASSGLRCHESNSIHHLHHLIGYRTVQRLLQGNVQTFEAGPTTTESTRFTHNSSRIPAYSKARTEGIHQIAQNGTVGIAGPLPYLDKIQRSFGPRHDLSKVKTYVGGHAAEATQRIGAEAYTFGDRVVFGALPNIYTAAHEATHVVQQRGGVQLDDGLGQTNDKYEQQADQVANEVIAGRSAENFLDKFVGRGKEPVGVQKHSVQFWGPEHLDFTRRAVDRWNNEHPKGRYMHIPEHLKTWMVKCSDDPDHTGRAFDILTPGNWSDFIIWGDFIDSGKEKRQKEYAKADPAQKKELYDAAFRSTCESEGPTHGEGNRPKYGSGGSAVNHAYMMSQVRWADRLTFGGFMSRAGAGQLGDAMHCAQDRGAHCEGNRHEGHDDVRDKLGIDDYNTDDPAKNKDGKQVADDYSYMVLAEFAKLRNQK